MNVENAAAHKQIYKVTGMDCAEEIAVLKREIGPLVGGEDKLSFDLLNGKMIVESATPFSDDDVTKGVARTGMRATVWNPATKQEAASFWTTRGRQIMTTASGAALSLAFIWHAVVHGVGDALSPEGDGGHTFPAASMVLYVIAVICGAWFVLPKALFSLRRVRPDMNLLMVVAVAGAIGIGEYFEAATVAFLFAVALLLESWSVGRARRAIAALMDLSPQTARCMEGEALVERPIAEVPVGTRVLVKPGERIPLDGLVVKGSTSVNQAPITGESMPVAKGMGDSVFAGSINESGAFEFETSKPAKDTTLARIIQMVEEAQSRRAPSEQWVESFARYYTPAMMALALAIAVLPPLLFSQPFEPWFYKSLVLLVIACPCALVISTPVSIVAGLSAAAKAGILIKGGAYLEAPSRLRVIAMDKTGTLTKGEPEVRRVIPFSGHDERELLELAAALEAHSEHPLARAIIRKAAEAGIAPAPAEDFKAIKGKGAEATIDGSRFWIGSHRLLHEKLGEATARTPQISQLEATGHAIVATGDEKRIAGLIGVSDLGTPVPQSDWSQKSVMLIGGNDASTKSMAELLSVDERDVKLLTAEQVNAIRELVQNYRYVFWVGSTPPQGATSLEPEPIHLEALKLEESGHSVIVVGNDSHVCGLIGIADALRPEAPAAVEALRKNGIEKIVMLTGDNEGTARAIGRLAGVDDLRYEMLPEDKVEAIRQLVKEYGAVAMVGDGVNDAPALATATLAVAMGAAGSDAALETADIALMADDLSKLPWLIQHSRRTLGVIKQNIAFALGIKVVFIVLSLIGFASLWMAIAADTGASLLVIANGLRLLKTVQPDS